MRQMRDSTIIYRSFYEAIIELPTQNQAEVWKAVFEYSLNFTEIELVGLSKTIFTLIKPQLDANIKRYKSGILPKQKRSISETEAKNKQDASENEANVNDNENKNENGNGNKPPITINIGNRTFTGTTSEWLMLNKEQAVEVYFMNECKGLDLQAVFKKVDDSTVNYQFKDDNHPFNYFKSICRDFDKPNKKQQFNKPEPPKYKILKDD